MVITHLEVSKREINSAIRLLLKGEDIIAIHTIVAAAHEVTYAMCKRKEIKSFMKDICIKYIKKDFHKKYLKTLDEAGNFLKHATHDPDKKLDFQEFNTHFLLYDACNMYFELTKEFTKEMHAYSTFIRIKYPQLLAKNDPKYSETMQLVNEIKEKELSEEEIKDYLFEAFINE